MMQSKRNLFLWSVLAAIVYWNTVNVFSAAPQIGTITFLLGGADEIQIQHQAETNWTGIMLNSSVFESDIIKTQTECRCEVKLTDGSIIRIGENTTFQFTKAAIQKNQQNFQSELKRGQVWANLSQRKSKKKGFRIKTPTAVCAVRGTIYRVDADTMHTTTCLVYDGAVDVGPTSFWGQAIQKSTKTLEPQQVSGPQQIPGPFEVSLDQWIQIVKGFQIQVRADGKYTKSKFDEKTDAQLDWVQWNLNKDEMAK
jgi:hypothetical protein